MVGIKMTKNDFEEIDKGVYLLKESVTCNIKKNNYEIFKKRNNCLFCRIIITIFSMITKLLKKLK